MGTTKPTAEEYAKAVEAMKFTLEFQTDPNDSSEIIAYQFKRIGEDTRMIGDKKLFTILREGGFPTIVYEYFYSFLEYLTSDFDMIHFMLNAKVAHGLYINSIKEANEFNEKQKAKNGKGKITIDDIKPNINANLDIYNLSEFLQERFDNVVSTYNSLPLSLSAEEKIEYMRETLYHGFDISWTSFLEEQIKEILYLYNRKEDCSTDFELTRKIEDLQIDRIDLMLYYYPLLFDYVRSEISLEKLEEEIRILLLTQYINPILSQEHCKPFPMEDCYSV